MHWNFDFPAVKTPDPFLFEMKYFYFGPYYTDLVARERGLPSVVIAARNRMRRIGEALSCGGGTTIVSGAITLRCRLKWRIYSPRVDEQQGPLSIQSVGALNIPILGYIFESFFLVCYFFRNVAPHRRHSRIILYNFAPSQLPLLVLARLFRIPIYCDLEDISKPRIDDWLGRGDSRPVQQLIYGLSMSAVLRFVDGVFGPAKSFAWVCRPGTFKAIGGCLLSKEISPPRLFPGILIRPLNVLFVGKYEYGHGYMDLVAALHRLASAGDSQKFRFVFTGAPSIPAELAQLQLKFPSLNIDFRGFVCDSEYAACLAEADICLALQRTEWRMGDFKVPSKAYEFLGAGKCVVSANVGDILEQYQGALFLWEKQSDEELARILTSAVESPNHMYKMAGEAYEISRRNSSPLGVYISLKALFEASDAPG